MIKEKGEMLMGSPGRGEEESEATVGGKDKTPHKGNSKRKGLGGEGRNNPDPIPSKVRK